MSTMNITQLIEKKRENSSFHYLWRTGQNLTCVPEENMVFDNCLTTMPASKRTSVEELSLDNCQFMEFNANQRDLEKTAQGKIHQDRRNASNKDSNAFNVEGLQTIKSVGMGFNLLNLDIKEFVNENSNTDYFETEKSKCPFKAKIQPKTNRHTESENQILHGSTKNPKSANTDHKGNIAMSSETNLNTVPVGDSEPLHGLSGIKPKENESEMSEPLTTNFEDTMEVDDVDYYDSEDEYWSTQEVYVADEYLKKYVDDTSQSSERYSKGVEQARNLHVFRRSIHTFASDNNFEVHDVVPDGNCMFRAITDQLMINGFPGHTETSLRQDAINYLRAIPVRNDVEHQSAFLSGETWEEYLTRMERSREWGDHIVLQALVDVYSLQVIVFNVFQEDIRRTEVVVESDAHNEERLTVFLGHLGEFHYLSLRPKNWFKQWPYKALLCRLLVCSINPANGSFETVIREKVSNMGKNKYISDSELDKTSAFITQTMRRHHTTNKDSHEMLTIRECLFISFSGQDLELEDTKDSLMRLIEDPLLTDSVSGIPLPHLSIILTHLMPVEMILQPCYEPCTRHTTSHYRGSVEDGTEFIRLIDISRSQKMTEFYSNQEFPKHLVFLKSGLEASLLEDADILKTSASSSLIYIDTSKTKPGYCRLVLHEGHVPETDQITHRTESRLYLAGFNIPDLPKASDREKIAIGIKCAFHIVGREWFLRRKQFNFPSPSLQMLIFGMHCTLVPGAHHQSDNPAIEWKMNFSMVESVILESLSRSQRYGFNVFKILVDNTSFHLERRLKTKHLKAVLFHACEVIPTFVWEFNLGGCILFLLSKLLSCLKKRTLPHYFIPQRNLIERFSADDIATLCIVVESVRVFPVHVSQFVVEKHGITYGENLVRSILDNSVSFSRTRDVDFLIIKVIPETHRTAKFFARLGFYFSAFCLLCDVHMITLCLSGINEPTCTSLYDFVNCALQQWKQRSSRVILARMFDKYFGTKMIRSYLRESKESLEKRLSWSSNFRINWVEVPENNAVDLISIADFLYEHSLNEYHKRNATLASDFIETAIQCIKEAFQEGFIEIENIEDMELKNEILAQKRKLKIKLQQYYKHVFEVSFLYRKMYPLVAHILDMVGLVREFPEMEYEVDCMFTYLKMYDKIKEYAKK